MKQRSIDPDAPPTSFEDWRHAHVRRGFRSKPPRPPIPDGLTFHVFQASNNRKLFVVTDGRDPSGLVECPDSGLWIPRKTFRETGEKRIGMSEAEAKADIHRQGFHLMDLDKRYPATGRAPAGKKGLAESRGRYRKKTNLPGPTKRRATR